jgi:hypothetical protein
MRYTDRGLYISGALVVLAACSSAMSPDDERASATSRAIVGRWTFVRACGGIAPTCRSIGQTTEPTEYVFRSDGTVTLVPQQGTSFARSYQIIARPKGDPRSSLIIGGAPLADPRPLQVSFDGDTILTLYEDCCGQHVFGIDYQRAR